MAALSGARERHGAPRTRELLVGLRRLVGVMPISEITRRAIIDELSLSNISWSGRLEEPGSSRSALQAEGAPQHR